MYKFIFGLLVLSLFFAVECDKSYAQSSGVTSTSSSKAEIANLPLSIPVQRDGTELKQSGQTDFSSFFIALLLILIIGGYFYLTKKKGYLVFSEKNKNSNVSLKVVKQLALTPKHSLHLISWNNEYLLLACSEQGVQVVSKNTTDHAVLTEQHDLLNGQDEKIDK